ncbi:helix-turn-helix domain-containing protein [Haloarculaceae archaeon H-GB2-1]|nr:helix-turn-helix domain-containing protein [Haloarculaceae archaeon H-GB1-1]MEA5385841.1 helix-turn-helix domain-containing protein [Haloarculaceae archaeon H-GB11]MEA5407343.1 helix-turn-helix domain-containing protein [Haloarculaceae archaeon H-GB2-1]
MATVAEFSIEPTAVPLQEIFDVFPAAQIELERVVPLEQGIVPYLWISGIDASGRDVLASLHALSHVRIVDLIDDEVLCRADWERCNRGFFDPLIESNVSLLSATCTADGWTVIVRGEDRGDVAAFQERCLSGGVPLTLSRIHSLTPLLTGHEYTLTDPQRTALLLAFERGYFDTPRETTLEELAGELGITRQALASRLRRGHRRLIEATLVEL